MNGLRVTVDGVTHLGTVANAPEPRPGSRCRAVDPDTKSVLYDGPAPIPQEWWDKQPEGLVVAVETW